MSETTQTVNDTTTEVVETTQQAVEQSASNPFAEESWADVPVNSSAAEQQTTQEQKPTVETTQEPKPIVDESSDVIDEDEFIKTKLGFDNIDAAKAAIEELNKLKSGAKNEYEMNFANDMSKKFYEYVKEGKEDELFNFLSQKKKIESFTTSEINESNAADIIKFSMQQKYQDLSKDEIDYKFNKQYGIPKEPIQGVDELDSEFEFRKEAWQSEVNAIKKEMVIDAKLAKPEIDKLKYNLVLPDISKKETQQISNEPTQEELEAQKKYVGEYLKQVSETLKDINELSLTVKDEEVEIPVTYSLSEDEKNNVAKVLNEFAENNFDANALFRKRWLNSDNTLNIKQIAKDWIKLTTDDKVSQKFVNEAAQKRLAAYIKSKSNININETQNNSSFKPQGGEVKEFMDAVWGA